MGNEANFDLEVLDSYQLQGLLKNQGQGFGGIQEKVIKHQECMGLESLGKGQDLENKQREIFEDWGLVQVANGKHKQSCDVLRVVES